MLYIAAASHIHPPWLICGYFYKWVLYVGVLMIKSPTLWGLQNSHMLIIATHVKTCPVRSLAWHRLPGAAGAASSCQGRRPARKVSEPRSRGLVHIRA